MTRTWPEFYNPYHFVPAKNGGRIDDLCKTAFENRQLKHVTHDRYVDNTYSGRVICRLTAETPFFVGDEIPESEKATETRPGKPNPFKIDDKPAIPATSLRGVISNIAEAASNSAMRMLEERILSHRKNMSNSLSAIGMVIKRQNSNDYLLLPLSMPMIQIGNGIDTRQTALQDYKYLIDNKYKKMFSNVRFKVYINNYDEKKTFNLVQPEYYYMQLKNDWSYSNDKIDYNQLLRFPHRRDRTENTSCIIGQKPENNNYEMLAEERTGYVRGIVRILGKNGRGDIPGNKKHELFIPFPKEAEKIMKGEELSEQESKFWKTFPIPASVVQRFNQLSDERAEATKKNDKHHPYELLGTERITIIKGKESLNTLRLKHGDLVYFAPEDAGNDIAEVSFSSIWRRSAGGTTYDYFSAIDSELLPFNSQRNSITIAEQLFGFVEQDFLKDKLKNKSEHMKALASRLRFSHAPFGHWKDDKNTGKDYYLSEVVLKILASPKPPSPALYFKKKDGSGGYISKQELSPQKHHPQGRKFYLHQNDKDKKSWATNPPWKTGNENVRTIQKVKISPVKEGTIFYFHIDFDNLSDVELGLLLYSLNPSNTFQHKLGMGKPIGLGSVKIEPVGLFTVNRKDRYTVQSANLFGGKRYHNIWVRDNKTDLLPAIYDREIVEYENCNKLNNLDYEKIKNFFAGRIDKDIQKMIEIMGVPTKEAIPVHYPQLTNMDIENENFRWFGWNDNKDNNNKQFLKPLEPTKLF